MQKQFQLTTLVWCAASVVAACAPVAGQDPGVTKESAPEGLQAEVKGAEGGLGQPLRREVVTAAASSSDEVLRGLPPYPFGDRID